MCIIYFVHVTFMTDFSMHPIETSVMYVVILPRVHVQRANYSVCRHSNESQQKFCDLCMHVGKQAVISIKLAPSLY